VLFRLGLFGVEGWDLLMRERAEEMVGGFGKPELASYDQKRASVSTVETGNGGQTHI